MKKLFLLVSLVLLTSAASCPELTPLEEQFVLLLSPPEKRLFCEKFDEKQRIEAMRMAGNIQNGVVVLPDMAVGRIANEYNISYPPAGE